MTTILKAKQITKYYKNNSTEMIGLDNVSLDIQEGEFVVIMGASGSGKSTLLYSLSGMDQVDEGEIVISEELITSMSEKELTDFRRTYLGFIFQQPTLLKNLNLLDNIILPAYHEGKKDKQKLVKEAKRLMIEMGIGDFQTRETHQVSGGQLQRVGICRALINQPKILFGDEPTGALNSKSSADIMLLLEKINENGMTVLLVTHDVKVAASADRVLLMKDGQIVGNKRYNDLDKEKRMIQATEWLTDYDI